MFRLTAEFMMTANSRFGATSEVLSKGGVSFRHGYGSCGSLPRCRMAGVQKHAVLHITLRIVVQDRQGRLLRRDRAGGGGP